MQFMLYKKTLLGIDFLFDCPFSEKFLKVMEF
jgi:hypothetical protein